LDLLFNYFSFQGRRDTPHPDMTVISSG
jgi:hypothetical protein